MTGFFRDMMGKMMPGQGSIDCNGVLAQLYEYIDEELDEETVEKIREHLEVCKRCYPRLDFEQAFLRFVADQGRVSAPPELRRKIFEAILEEESRP
jgi:anti-sigma factor (TIGR02949 family)